MLLLQRLSIEDNDELLDFCDPGPSNTPVDEQERGLQMEGTNTNLANTNLAADILHK